MGFYTRKSHPVTVCFESIFRNAYRFSNSWTSSSNAFAYVYVRGSFADNVITTTRLVNNMTFPDGKAYKITLQ